ncbi:MAG TPA: hypothetical protein PKM73_01915 [Verrucomicrobiota bacterium]|nr:hypothetical protein [Verrucomicrobiota bacterium]HNU50307.1 hypothetical protein [Verrucomicrobiota bacterium]
MNTIVETVLNALELGPAQARNGIIVIPLVGFADADPPYLILDQALANHGVEISEVSVSGSVPHVRVTNASPQAVLCLDGEELVGAKQNRVLNTSILLPPLSQTLIPVSCVEQGRWAYSTHNFRTSNAVLTRQARCRKARSVSESLAQTGTFASDQGEVWQEVALLHAKAGTRPVTGALHDVYQAKAAELEAALEAFPWVPGQIGVIVVHRGEVAGCDVIPRPAAYAALHSKLLRSHLLDALLEPGGRKVSPQVAAAKALVFLKTLPGCVEQAYASPGCGTDLRYRGRGVVGAGLVHDQHLLHAVFCRLVEPRPRAHKPVG